MLEIPYARYVQITRRIALETAKDERKEYQRAAFLGWQFHASMGGKAKYGEYLEMFKLGDAQPEDDLEPAKEFDKTAHLERMARIVAADQAQQAARRAQQEPTGE